jgi:hypothetical protein
MMVDRSIARPTRRSSGFGKHRREAVKVLSTIVVRRNFERAEP